MSPILLTIRGIRGSVYRLHSPGHSVRSRNLLPRLWHSMTPAFWLRPLHLENSHCSLTDRAEKKSTLLSQVHTKALLNQWVNSLGEFLEISEELPMESKSRGRRKKRSLIGQIGSGKRNMSGIVDVAILQSLLSGDEVDTLVRNYGMVIVDECHHVSAVNFERVLKGSHCKICLWSERNANEAGRSSACCISPVWPDSIYR